MGGNMGGKYNVLKYVSKQKCLDTYLNKCILIVYYKYYKKVFLSVCEYMCVILFLLI